MAGQVKELESKVALQQAILDGYKVELYGQPVPWPQELPDQFRPEHFQASLAAAIEEVEAPVDLLGFDCSEPPCIAMLRMLPGEGGNITASDTWARLYGTNISSNANDTIDCGDGRTERIRLLAPAWDFKSDPSKMTKDEYWQALRARRRDEASRNYTKRLKARWNQLKAGWQCAQASRVP